MNFFYPLRVALISLLTVACFLHCTASAVAATDEPEADQQEDVYLFTTFRGNGEDGLRFAYSFDGLQWANVPGRFLKPLVGDSKLMRDPSLLRGPDGTFHLVWTTGWKGDQGFGHSSSADLVHWSPQQFVPVMQHEPTTVNVWAPELFYDDVQMQYIICWASTIPGRFPDYQEDHDNNHRMYYTTTKDFKTFTPSKLFLDPDFSVIDCRIVKRDHDYVLVLKDNTRPERNLRVAFGETPLGPWENISPPFTRKFTEGPTVLNLEDEWLIYYDAYQDYSYGAVKTRDFKSFTNIDSEVAFPEGHKHGTALKITRKELAYLIRVGSEQIRDVRLPVEPALPQTDIDKRLAAIDQVAKKGPFQPNWDSLKGFQTPEWLRDGKFGIFIHWGPYSVPAFGSEWYPRNMYSKGTPEYDHHLKEFGPHAEFGYKDFIPLFKAEKFDPAAWADLFHEAGVKYVIPVAEHHDGFPMYDCEFTEWSAAKKGPQRDILGELAPALREREIVFGASSHRAEHWWFFDQGMLIDSDVLDPRNSSLYGPANNKRVAETHAEMPDKQFLDDWLLRTCEIVDKYQPEVIYFDWWICQPVFQPYLQRFAAYYYNRGAEWGKQVTIDYKQWEGQSFPEGTGVFDIERGLAPGIRPDFWQTDTSVSKNSWGYVSNHEYKDVDSIIDDLIDVVSKNGALLLNIGPKADGTIPEPEQRMLRTIGAWLKVNGEAIYSTRPWKMFGEGPTLAVGGSFADTKRQPFTGEDFRFTTKGDTLYAIALAPPENEKLLVKSLSTTTGNIESVSVLGSDDSLEWSQSDKGLAVDLPPERISEFAITLKITGLKLNQPAGSPE
ncbi:alpha-L-fucosidase [Bythopirellula goksoeyrii]|uniref:alpha-L-fucosidase n=1 Tax=Bythopirellula goksoeyrii TaxID=1400387 RepID=A0A5B9QFS6_9BACT|nr:alpha-L-fucosidase [Bythopirellula goksoeyrii]QEG35766.1 Alpha-L-fucosidase [Bythopirellula goksoeyrii]